MLNKIIKTAILAVVLLSVNQKSFAAAIDDFVIVVKTSNPGTSANNEFTIPTTGGGYNYNVDCDYANPGTNTATARTGNYTCVYPTVGSYTVRIINNISGGNGFPRIYFSFASDTSKVTKLLQWGTGKWTSMERAFTFANNLSVSTTDSPNLASVTNMSSMFRHATIANPDTSSWNTENVTDMSLMFEGATIANPDTSNWNTSAVVNMKRMFFAATSANPDTSNWNTANVTDMSNMFAGSFSSTSLANPDTSNWNTANVTNMSGMFQNATVADPDTSGWNTANVTNMFFMFQNAVSANPDTSNWDISQVTNMQIMFSGVTLPTDDYDAMLIGFNAQTPQSGLSFQGGNSKYCATAARANLISALGHGWSITDGGLDPNCPAPTDNFVFEVDTTIAGSTTNLQFEINTVGAGYDYNVDCDDANPGNNIATAQTGNYTCNYASAGIYTIRLSDNVGDKTGFPRLFSFFHDDAKKIIDLKQWGTGIWTSMVGTFNGASNMIVTATDIPNLSQVSNTTGMFQDAILADPNTTNWDVSNINTMLSMFANATSANPNTAIWDVSNVTTMYRMFNGATSANPDVSEWSTANVTDMRKMFEEATSATPEINEWTITGITTPNSMQNMLTGLTLTTTLYDSILDNFNIQTTASGIVFDAGNSQYCNVADRAALISSGWTITDGGIDPACSGVPTDDFVIEVTTDNSGTSANNEFTIPTSGGGYNYNVDCEDDGTNEATGINGDYTCVYPIAGTYTIRIKDNTGTLDGFPRIYFNNQGDRSKIIDVVQWGIGKWTSMDSAFFGANNMLVSATDVPNFSQLTSLRRMFRYATSANPNTSNWNTVNVTSMNGMFSFTNLANPNTSNWNTANVTNMGYMFSFSTLANPDTSNWNTASVTGMFSMFSSATSANPDTSNWNTANVTNMQYMFRDTTANPDTSNWNTANVTKMHGMFYNATSANPDTSNWNTANVTNMQYMFRDTTANPDTSNWNTANVTNMHGMFESATSANPDTSNWNTANVTNMKSMFKNATSANPNTSNWNTANVTNMDSMFYNATSANPDTSSWDITNVEEMEEMFFGVTLPTIDYDGMLIGFNAQDLQPDVIFDGGNSKYCLLEAQVARASIVDNDNWTIIDGGLDPNCGNDIIFKNSFEIPVTTFAATQKHFVFDFSLLENVKLDNNPYLIAIGLNSEQEQTIKVHVRKLEEQLQIRMSHFYQDDYEGYWETDEWQDIFNNKMTTVSW